MTTENNASVLDYDDHRPRIIEQKSPASRDFRREFAKRTHLQVDSDAHLRHSFAGLDTRPLTTHHYVPRDHFGLSQTAQTPKKSVECSYKGL